MVKGGPVKAVPKKGTPEHNTLMAKYQQKNNNNIKGEY